MDFERVAVTRVTGTLTSQNKKIPFQVERMVSLSYYKEIRNYSIVSRESLRGE
jgi:hypothetical protein